MVSLPPRLARTLYWTSQVAQGNQSICGKLRLLNETQYWEPARLRDLQFRKLRALVEHAYETVPYYRDLMDRHGLRPERVRDFDDYRRLPMLSRATLRTHMSQMLSRTAGADQYRRQSSGSTGEPVAFWQDRDFDRWCRAHQLRAYAWCGSWRLGEPFALMWGSPTYFETRGRLTRIDNAFSNRVELDAFRLDQASLERLVAKLLDFQPVLISGYTTAIYLIARMLRERNLALPMLRAVQPNAEPLNDLMRKEIERGFSCEVFDKYGSRETNIVAHESPHHDGLRIQAEHTYVEFVDEEGAPCQPGTLGRLVLTTLNNHVMPLLRYETSDLASSREVADRSGIGLPAMSPVIGRTHDILCTPDGGFIHPQLFSNVLREQKTIDWFQVVQQREDTLLIRVVTRHDFKAEEQMQIIDSIRSLTGFDFAVEFDQLSGMPHSPTGKFRLCVCDLPGNSQDRGLRFLNDLRRQDPFTKEGTS